MDRAALCRLQKGVRAGSVTQSVLLQPFLQRVPREAWLLSDRTNPVEQKGPSPRRVGRRTQRGLSFGGLSFLTGEGGLCRRSGCNEASSNVLYSFGFHLILIKDGGLHIMLAYQEDVHLRAADMLISSVRHLPTAPKFSTDLDLKHNVEIGLLCFERPPHSRRVLAAMPLGDECVDIGLGTKSSSMI